MLLLFAILPGSLSGPCFINPAYQTNQIFVTPMYTFGRAQTLVYEHKGDPHVFVDLHWKGWFPPQQTTPAGGLPALAPVLHLLHGGSFMSGSVDENDVSTICANAATRGWACISSGYRLDGTAAFMDGTMEGALDEAVWDADEMVVYVKTNSGGLHVAPNFYVLGGASAGGVLALAYAYAGHKKPSGESPSPVNAILSISGSMGGSAGCSTLEPFDTECKCTYLSSNTCNPQCMCMGETNTNVVGNTSTIPLYIAHGEIDAVVPYPYAVDLKTKAESKGMTVGTYFIPNIGHCPGSTSNFNDYNLRDSLRFFRLNLNLMTSLLCPASDNTPLTITAVPHGRWADRSGYRRTDDLFV